MNPIKKYYENLAKSLIEKFNKRRFEAYYCADRSAALAKALELIPENCSVSHGGSETIRDIGLIDSIKKGKYNYIDAHEGSTNEDKKQSLMNSIFCDFFLMSANAITQAGELVNIDNMGNRISALTCGPDNVLLIIGMNKYCENIENGIWRIQNIASPKNTTRFNLQTPCSITGCCGDCYGDESICSTIAITRRSVIPGRIKIILVGEELGY